MCSFSSRLQKDLPGDLAPAADFCLKIHRKFTLQQNNIFLGNHAQKEPRRDPKLFCHLLGVFLSLFSDLGFASVVNGSPDPNKLQEDRKILKNGPQKGHNFHKNYFCDKMIHFLVSRHRFITRQCHKLQFAITNAETNEKGSQKICLGNLQEIIVDLGII